MPLIEFLKKIRAVSSFIDENRLTSDLPYEIEEIKKAILAHSNVDQILFIPFDDPENPIKGRYQRYDLHCGPYQLPTTRVEVHYNKGLNTCWRRFVVCKEMCHSLEDDPGRVSTKEDLAMLVDGLLSPAERLSLPFLQPFLSESCAQFAALELLCPLSLRKAVIKRRKTEELSHMAVATAFRIPLEYTKEIFSPKYVDLVEEMFTAMRD